MPNYKELIKEIANDLGFHQVSFASLAPLENERAHFSKWLDMGFQGTMNYMAREPETRLDPARPLPQAKSVIVLAVNYFTPRPPKPGPFHGAVASYAVGRDYHLVIPEKISLFKNRVDQLLNQTSEYRTCTDSAPVYELGLAARHGIGFSGKHTLIIGPKLSGSYNFLCELFLDTDLETFGIKPDGPYQGTCGDCFRCGSACPTGAIQNHGDYFVDARLCISYQTIENKESIPLELRSKLGNWVFGCDVCQEVCPYNSRTPTTPWSEFKPEAGVGHYLDLFSTLKIKTQAEFKSLYAHTPLSRPKRKGILRNALICIGNEIALGNDDKFALQKLFEFASNETELVLREHATWAISQSTSSSARYLLDKISSLDLSKHS